MDMTDTMPPLAEIFSDNQDRLKNRSMSGLRNWRRTNTDSPTDDMALYAATSARDTSPAFERLVASRAFIAKDVVEKEADAQVVLTSD